MNFSKLKFLNQNIYIGRTTGIFFSPPLNQNPLKDKPGLVQRTGLHSQLIHAQLPHCPSKGWLVCLLFVSVASTQVLTRRFKVYQVKNSNDPTN